MVCRVYVVDENDNVVSESTKREVHEKMEWHRVSHVLVFNRRGEILIHKRASHKRMFPCLWDYIVGGHVEIGESYEEAAKREVTEEIGVEAKGMKELLKTNGVIERNGQVNKEIVKIFAIVTELSVDDMTPEKKEISEMKFIPFSELEKISKNEEEHEKFVSFLHLKKTIPGIRNFLKDFSLSA
ncbi:MAG: NUDIX domain-containing protein [Candidatus Aenigmarchaeota archaeon]|nr:NUDIX domain-containing protein [Candidatus Aenigmarchaeota archaeon]